MFSRKEHEDVEVSLLEGSVWSYREGVLYGEGVNLREVMEKYGTPLYVYSEKRIRENCRRFLEVCKEEEVRVYYAMKANDRKGVLEIVKGEGLGVDVVSGGEIARALHAGFVSEDVVFSGVGKVEEDIEYAVKRRVGRVNVESFEELKMWSFYGRRHGHEVKIAFRYTPGIEAGDHEKIMTAHEGSKFGLNDEEVVKAWEEVEGMEGVNAVGLACHLGSQIVKVEPYVCAVESLCELGKRLRDFGFDVKSYDLGGGFGIDYGGGKGFDVMELRGLVRNLRGGCGADVEVDIEPGRSIVGDAGVLLGKVGAVKGGGRIVVTDVGMNNFMRPTLYGSYHHVLPVERKVGERKMCEVVGPICESGDVWGKGRWLPLMREGEGLVMMHTGAYGSVLSNDYNARGRAGEVSVRGDEVREWVSRKRGWEEEGFC